MSHDLSGSPHPHARHAAAVVTLAVAVLVCLPGDVRAAGQASEAALPSTTKVLTGATTQYLESISSDGAVFTFSRPTTQLTALAPGDVLASGMSPVAPYGFLRKVLAVSSAEGGRVMVITRAASLKEAINAGTARLSRPLSRDALERADLAPGVTLAQTEQALLDTGLIELRFDAILFDGDRDPTTTLDRVRATGRANLRSWVDFQMDVGASTADLTLNFTETSELRIDAPIANGDFHPRVQVARLYFEPSAMLVGGVLPLVIVPVLTVEVGLDGSVHEGLLVGVTQTATLTAGLHYEDGRITPTNPFSNDFPNHVYPILYGDVDLKAYTGPRLALLLYGIGGQYGDAWGQIDAYLRLHADRGVEPWWRLYGGLEGRAGFSLFDSGGEALFPFGERQIATSGTDPEDDSCTDAATFRVDDLHRRLWGGIDFMGDRDWASIEAPAATKMLLAMNPVGEAEDTYENYDLELWVPPPAPRTPGMACTTPVGASRRDATYRYRLRDRDGNLLGEYPPIGAWGDERLLVDVVPGQEYRSEVSGNTLNDYVPLNPLLPPEANYLLSVSFGSMKDAFTVLQKAVSYDARRTADAPFGTITVQMTIQNATAAEYRNLTFLVTRLDTNHRLLSAEVHSRTHGPVWLQLDVDNPAVRGAGATVSVPNMAFCYGGVVSSLCTLQEQGNLNSSGDPDDRFEIRFRIGAQAKQPLSSFVTDIYASPLLKDTQATP